MPLDAEIQVEEKTRQLQSEGELTLGWTGAHEDVDAPGSEPLRGFGREYGAHWLQLAVRQTGHAWASTS